MLYLKKTPSLLKKIFPNRIWDINTDEKVLYFTFDDGPHTEATSLVLDELKKYDAKATFFCIGKNVKENFPIFQNVIAEGHRVGNHTYHHLNGWKTKDRKYLDDVLEAKKIIDSNLFRPPYGRITNWQVKAIEGEKFQLKTVMWDVLSGDFDRSVSGDDCYLNVLNNAQKGSIVVFHDSEKAFPALQYALPRLLSYYSANGFTFAALP